MNCVAGSGSYRLHVGLEIHVQLNTQSKLFCGCRVSYGAPPNVHICPTCAGYPGTLPIVNECAVRWGIRAGLAVGGEISQRLLFHRKHYFYPDLPKGYQISQGHTPLVRGGEVGFDDDDGNDNRLELVRMHLEEDAGKSMHEGSTTRVDLNRCGTPLLEIVTQPHLTSPRQAELAARAIRELIGGLGISNVNMEQGSLRCDVNVSVRSSDSATLGTRVEIKNLNSFRSIAGAIEAERDRQIERLRSGQRVIAETRGYDERRRRTVRTRSKESFQDYRYLQEPDIPATTIPDEWLSRERAAVPESARDRRRRYVESCNLSRQQAAQLSTWRWQSDLFEELLAVGVEPLAARNFLLDELRRVLKELAPSWQDRDRPGLDGIAVTELQEWIVGVNSGQIDRRVARKLLLETLRAGGSLSARMQQLTSAVGAGEQLDPWVRQVLEDQDPRTVDSIRKIRAGDFKPLSYLVGEVLRRSGGRAQPRRVHERLRDLLGEAATLNESDD